MGVCYLKKFCDLNPFLKYYDKSVFVFASAVFKTGLNPEN